MTGRAAVFAAAALGAPLLAAVVFWVIAFVADISLLGPLALGLVLALAQAAWIAARRLPAAAAWAATATAGLAYLVLTVGVVAVLLSRAELR